MIKYDKNITLSRNIKNITLYNYYNIHTPNNRTVKHMKQK